MSDIYLWETYDHLGKDALDQGDLQQAVQAFSAAVATAEEIGSHDRLVLSLRNLAATMTGQGRISEAHELLTRTLQVALEFLDEHHSQTIECQRDLGAVCRDLGFLDQAEGHLKAVLDHEGQEGPPEQLTETLITLAQIATAKENPRKASEHYQRVVEIRTSVAGDQHPDVAQALLWFSTSLFRSGETDAAEAPMSEAFKILEKQFVDAPEHLAQSFMAGAQLMLESGQLESALTLQKRALDILTNNFVADDEKIWETREYIATTLAGLGKLEEAIELLEFCLRNREDSTEIQNGATYKNLAGLYLSLGQIEKAEQYYEQATKLIEETLGASHPIYIATLEERVQLYHFNNRPKEALALALKTIKTTESRFGPGHPSTAEAYASVALLAHRAEEWETALELMRAAEKIWQTLRPRPDDVLANCRANIATCLLKMERYSESSEALSQAELTAEASLKPIIANLRDELEAARPQSEASVPTDDEAIASDSEAELETESESESETEAEVAPALSESEFELPDIDDLIAGDLPPVCPAPEQSEQPAAKDDPTFDLYIGDLDILDGPSSSDTDTKAEQEPEPEVESEATISSPSRFAHDFVERRAASRTPLSLNRFFDIDVRDTAENRKEKVKSFLVDLAPGGIRINSESPFLSGEEVVLTLPQEVLGEETEFTAQVVWQKPLYGSSYLQGIQFRNLTSAQERLLTQRVNQNDGGHRPNSRQHFRLYRPFPIKIQTGPHSEWVDSYATDLSIDGLGTRLQSFLDKNSQILLRLELEFELPTVEVEARVAWSKESENGIVHGLQFASVGPVEAKTIKRYIDRCVEFLPD